MSEAPFSVSVSASTEPSLICRASITCFAEIYGVPHTDAPHIPRASIAYFDAIFKSAEELLEHVQQLILSIEEDPHVPANPAFPTVDRLLQRRAALEDLKAIHIGAIRLLDAGDHRLTDELARVKGSHPKEAAAWRARLDAVDRLPE